MLDRTSKRLLKLIVENDPNMDDGYFTYDYIETILGMKKDEVFDCVRFLENKDLVKCKWKKPDVQEGLFGVRPNHRGRHHAEFTRQELYKAIIESVLLPILVSVITAMLVAA